MYGYKESRIRYSKQFYKALEFLKKSEYWDAVEIENYQNAQIRKLVQYVYKNVPYYYELFNKLNIKPDDIKNRDDIKKLPVLTKEEVTGNQRNLISTEFHTNKLIKSYTGGTTGARLELYKTSESVAYQWAVWWRHRMRYGISMNESHVNFTTKNVVPIDQLSPPFWRRDYYRMQHLIGMNQITESKVAYIVDYLSSVKTMYYTGPPSIIYAFTSLATDMELKLQNPPKYVFYGAENMQQYQRNNIEAYTGATISDQYGATEGAGNISRCEYLRYHEDFEFGLIEYCNPIKELDGTVSYDIICTGFTNYAFPLIRYKIGDRAVLKEENNECLCGRSSRQIECIVGRIEDYIVTPEGNKIMALPVVYSTLSSIKEVQAIQYYVDEVILKIVRRNGYNSDDENYLRSEFKRLISPSLRLSFQYVDSIDREPNGKFRVIKSYINKSRHN